MTAQVRPAVASWKAAYDAQVALWRFYHSEQGMAFLESSLEGNTAGLNSDLRDFMLHIYRTEPNRMIAADPIFVSAEMGHLVAAASEAFRPEPLLVTDLLTEIGFVYFAEPFPVLDRFQEPTDIAGFSWMPIIGAKDKSDVTNENVLDYWRGAPGFEETDGPMAGVGLTIYATSDVGPPVLPMHLTPWWFGMTFEGNESDELGEATGAEWWWRIVQTSLRLMKQRIAVKHTERLDRGRRRESQRLKFPEREVLHVHLRREVTQHRDPPGEEANYSHRFIVQGHWRNQWYPSLGKHRQIWISPYVKGPEGTELIVKPRRAYVWDR